MAEAGYDSDNPEEEVQLPVALRSVAMEDRFEFTPVICPVMDELEETFPDTTELFEKWYASN